MEAVASGGLPAAGLVNSAVNFSLTSNVKLAKFGMYESINTKGVTVLRSQVQSSLEVNF